jgi:hypothetical protein
MHGTWNMWLQGRPRTSVPISKSSRQMGHCEAYSDTLVRHIFGSRWIALSTRSLCDNKWDSHRWRTLGVSLRCLNVFNNT